MSIIILLLVIDLAGCEALARKFTRKKKKDTTVQEELVLAPEEYKNPLSTEDQYREYFSFWQSWQGELVESLLQKKSNKKQKTCADEALKNLSSMRRLLKEPKQKKLDVYIARMKSLRDSIANDIYGNNTTNYMERAEQLKMSITKEFSAKDVKDFLL